MKNMNKCVFLDRDGVINVERGDYTWKPEHFILTQNLKSALIKLKAKGFLLIIITNQGGINKGLYTKKDVLNCHNYLQKSCDDCIDDIFISPYHDNFTKSLTRKPNTLMFEKAIYKWNIDINQSWMVGDSERDCIAGEKLGIKSILIGKHNKKASSIYNSLAEIVEKNIIT